MQAAPSSPYTDIDALESELRRQLEDLDNMVNGSGGEGGAASRRDAQSIFDFVQRIRFSKFFHIMVALDVRRSIMQVNVL